LHFLVLAPVLYTVHNVTRCILVKFMLKQSHYNVCCGLIWSNLLIKKTDCLMLLTAQHLITYKHKCCILQIQFRCYCCAKISKPNRYIWLTFHLTQICLSRYLTDDATHSKHSNNALHIRVCIQLYSSLVPPISTMDVWRSINSIVKLQSQKERQTKYTRIRVQNSYIIIFYSYYYTNQMNLFLDKNTPELTVKWVC